MPKSNYAKQLVLKLIALNDQNVTLPTVLYLALFETDPTAAGNGVEASYTNYVRKAVAFNPSTIIGNAAIIQNSGEIQYPVVPAPSTSIAFAGLMTALNGGDLVYYGPLAATYSLDQGVQPVVPVGSLTVSEI